MTFCIISHVSHYKEQNQYFAYSPYIIEMNVWLKHVDKVIIVAPLNKKDKSAIDSAYDIQNVDFKKVDDFDITSVKNLFKTIIVVPIILIQIYKAMKQADHIHLRCPGNMGLLGCLVQILFPKKKKTAKYAGNWDANAKQPFSYKLQKWILSNTFLTKNMQVLVYGEWENQTKNIKPFFTATYTESEKIPVEIRSLNTKIKFMFAGTLSVGKRPLYTVQLVEKLKNEGYNVELSVFGDGKEKANLENYIQEKNIGKYIRLEGNKDKNEVKLAYQQSHFLLLPSKSEGWPKVVAEAMFWGCLPISTSVSCVPNMLDNENRGLLLTLDLEKDTKKIKQLLNNEEVYFQKAKNAINWSRLYTLDYFEAEIKKLLL
jgi:glycosyltransferase involved in cell wall biosynthesis